MRLAKNSQYRDCHSEPAGAEGRVSAVGEREINTGNAQQNRKAAGRGRENPKVPDGGEGLFSLSIQMRLGAPIPPLILGEPEVLPGSYRWRIPSGPPA